MSAFPIIPLANLVLFWNVFMNTRNTFYTRQLSAIKWNGKTAKVLSGIPHLIDKLWLSAIASCVRTISVHNRLLRGETIIVSEILTACWWENFGVAYMDGLRWLMEDLHTCMSRTGCNQSGNQSINQTVNKSKNQSINQPINRTQV